MSRHVLRPVVAADVRYLAPRIREADRNEAWAAAHLRPDEAIIMSWRLSDEAYTWLAHGRPVAVFGVAGTTALDFETGCPWMLATDEIGRYWRDFLRVSKRFVPAALETWPRLENYVDARNVLAVRWLGWMGFEIEPARPFGPLQLPFHRFHAERAHVGPEVA